MPKTYKEYSYILAEYPNEMYDDRPYSICSICVFNWEQDENGDPCESTPRDYTWVEKYLKKIDFHLKYFFNDYNKCIYYKKKSTDVDTF